MSNSVCLHQDPNHHLNAPLSKIDQSNNISEANVIVPVCFCRQGYRNLPYGDGCGIRRIGEQCVEATDCVVEGSECSNTSVCVCKQGHYSSNRRDLCTRNRVYDSCIKDDNCTSVITNSRCLAGMCLCEVGYEETEDLAGCANYDAENIAIIAASIVAIGSLVIIDITLLVHLCVHFVL